MKHYLNSLLSLSLMLLTFSVTAAELKIAFASDRAPYCFRKDNVDQGIEIDLLRQIMALAGHTVTVTIMPKVRLIKAVKGKEVDAAATVQDNKDYQLFSLSLIWNFRIS